MDNVYFGLGSFHFYRTTEPEDEEENYRTYVDEIERILNACSNINNIVIENNHTFKRIVAMNLLYRNELEIDEDKMSYNKLNGIYPNPCNLIIEFDLFIPLRVQEDIHRKINPPKTYTENFKVYIIYDNYFPVVIVELINPKDDCKPSDGVYVVKKFLQNELEKKSEFLSFMSMGPSPFHGEFIITYTSYESEDFQVRLVKENRRGYHSYFFELNNTLDLEEYKSSIYLSIARELGYYYELEQISNRRNFNWIRIEVLVDMLLESYSLKFWNIKRYYKIRVLLNELFQSISRFERDEIFFRQQYNNAMKEIYANGESTFFKKDIDMQYENFMDFPVEQVLKYINTFEQRRLNLNEASSAIIGGVVGALLTILFAK
ncbi:hypothetical protein [Paenibacillus sp. HGF5]|uniref:hypothetical protein n=1 Tax=Paenibacillus sp. HGF5 TaxID=908341 RepID=UPI0002072D67|nr:hypothetical protein [Paenibacillus sp. HGF5]EGG35204.1 hypothetical protein HMPREF9412_3213 [Paenibacillus sp. HGF5]